MTRVAASLVACLAVGVAADQDMNRALSPCPGHTSKLRAHKKEEVFEKINTYMHSGGWLAKPCETFTAAELTATERAVAGHAHGRFNAVYERAGDRRARTAEGVAALPHTPANTTRDGHCAYILMLWAHHIPSSARNALHTAGTVLPLMPTDGPAATSDPLYTSRVSCAAGHYSKSQEAVPAAQDPSEPPRPRWGGNAQALHFSSHVNMTDISDSPLTPNWQFQYYYDAQEKASRYEHAKGNADECCRMAGWYSQGMPCTVLFANDGNTYLQSTDAPSKCCLSTRLSYYGAVRSEWLYTDASYVGAVTVKGVKTNEWFKQGASDNHYYATTNAAQLPVRYMEHKNGKLKQWDFDMASYNATKPSVSLFTPPAGCSATC